MIRSIRTAREFRELRAAGRRVSSGPLTMTVAPLAEPDASRVAYAVPRAVGPAVRRNRVRRRLRARLAELDRAGQLPPARYLVSCRADAVDLGHSELVSCLDQLLDQASSRP